MQFLLHIVVYYCYMLVLYSVHNFLWFVVLQTQLEGIIAPKK